MILERERETDRQTDRQTDRRGRGDRVDQKAITVPIATVRNDRTENRFLDHT